MDVGELRKQHRQLGEIAAQLSRVVADDRALQSVGALRWQLARQLMAHLALEDRIFYPAVQRLPDEPARAMARRLQTETGRFAEIFAAYMTRWNDDRISREWAGFCSETREMLSAFGSRIDKEERLLFPLLEGRPGAASRIRRVS